MFKFGQHDEYRLVSYIASARSVLLSIGAQSGGLNRVVAVDRSAIGVGHAGHVSGIEDIGDGSSRVGCFAPTGHSQLVTHMIISRDIHRQTDGLDGI